MKRSLLALAAVASMGLAAVSPSQAVLHEVQIVDFAFNPSQLQVAPGDSIRWTNLDAMPHTSTSGDECTSDGLWDSGTMNQGDTFIWVAGSAGEYYYYCVFHCPQMEGQINVEEETPNESTTWGQVRAVYR